MHLHRLCLVRVVTEKRLTTKVLAVLTEAGANGHTIYVAAGAGEHGDRDATTLDSTNVVIEVLTTEPEGTVMLQRVEEAFLPGAALIAYLLEVRTLRKTRFS